MANPSSSQRFKKLSSEEKEVGRRLAICRLREALSQTELAMAAGISRDQLARIENGRAMLTAGFAIALAQALQINLRWLAKAIPPAYRHVKIPQEVLRSIDLKGDFLSEFDASLALLFDAEHKGDVERLSQFLGSDEIETYHQCLTPEPENLSAEGVAGDFWPYLIESLNDLPPEMRRALKDRLTKETHRFKLENEAGIRIFSKAHLANAESGQEQIPMPENKDYLDKRKTNVRIARVRLKVPTWPELKRDILRFTTKRGDKTALANRLGVSRQVFGNWLSDGSQGSPNADLTLQLLNWVEEQKRLKK